VVLGSGLGSEENKRGVVCVGEKYVDVEEEEDIVGI
jgi:hypothetical protein